MDGSKAQEQLFAPGTSSARKYSALVVGRPGFLPLLAYELVITLSQGFPGALGLALRKVCYPWLLGRCGRNVVFGQNVVLRHPHKIQIGDDVVIYANASILGGETVIGARCLIGSNVWITESVPADTRVVMEKPRLRVRAKNADGTVDYQI